MRHFDTSRTLNALETIDSVSVAVSPIGFSQIIPRRLPQTNTRLKPLITTASAIIIILNTSLAQCP